MALVAKALAGLSGLTNKFWQFGDGDTAPVQIIIDPSTGLAVDLTLPAEIVGSVASGSTDTGKPVKVGGKYSASVVTLTDGQRGDLNMDQYLNVQVRTNLSAATGADGVGNLVGYHKPHNLASGSVPALNMPLEFNGATWDRRRCNQDGTAFASAARTGTPGAFDGVNHNAKGLHLVIDVTALASTPSVVFKVQGKDSLSGKFYDILTSAAVTAIGTVVLKVYPGLTGTANLIANDILPRNFRVIATHANGNSITYSVGYSLIN